MNRLEHIEADLWWFRCNCGNRHVVQLSDADAAKLEAGTLDEAPIIKKAHGAADLTEEQERALWYL